MRLTPLVRSPRLWLAALWLLDCGGLPPALHAEPVAVRHVEGVVHGFLVLRTLDGKTLADGDLLQFAHGSHMTSRLVFHFRDGSLHEETVVFSQRQSFRVLSDHLVQKGPAFPHPMDLTVDGVSGRVAVRTTDDGGKEKRFDDRLQLPPDVANGLVLTLLKNLPRDTKQLTLSLVAAAPKPRLVKLLITPAGEEPFALAGSQRKATHYVIKVEIGGVAGVVAPLVGKQPPDNHAWVVDGDVPAFVKSEGPLYPGGPAWRIELASPVWPAAPAAKAPSPGHH